MSRARAKQESEILTWIQIAKLIVHGKDRAEALSLLQRALGQYQVIGPSTNIEFLKAVAGHEAFAAGPVETSFVPVSPLLRNSFM